MKADILSEKVTTGHKDIPIFKLNPAFEKQAQLEADYQYEKIHGKPFKPTW